MMRKNVVLINIMIFVLFLNLIFIGSVKADIISSGVAGNNITWTLDDDGLLTLDGSGDMASINYKSPWVDYQDQVKNVEFIGNITSISTLAFDGNKNIKSIVLPSSLVSIDGLAFGDMTALETITMPSSLRFVGKYAFLNCSNLKEVVFPTSNTIQLAEGAFADCTSLEKIVFNSILAEISDEVSATNPKLTVPLTTKIYGYTYSGAYYYARHSGNNFVDVNTNKETTGKINNDMYLNKLPLDVTSNGVVGNILSYSGKDMDYTYSFFNDLDESDENYIAIKNVVLSLTEGLNTDEEKARAIVNWIDSNTTYSTNVGSFSLNAVYFMFNEKNGNCVFKTVLLNYMLYLCGIPTGSVLSATHSWTVALIDGNWVYIDATAGLYNFIAHNVLQITFERNGLVYALNDPTENPVVIGIAKKRTEIVSLEEYMIPDDSYIKEIDKKAFKEIKTLKAKVGTIGEQYIKNNCPSYSINNGIIKSEELVSKIDMLQTSVSGIKSKTYTGSAITVDLTITYDGKTLREGYDYVLKYQDNINVGSAKLIIDGINDYTGTITKTFHISTKRISDLLPFNGIVNKPYTGSKIEQNLIIKNGNVTLKNGVDYTVKYENNINVGMAIMTISGLKNYSGTVTQTFNILETKRKVGNTTVTMGEPYYTGKAITPTVIVKYGNTTLKLNTDYTLTYKNNVNVGSASVTITGKGNYTGSKVHTFKINPRAISLATVTVLNQNCTGTAINNNPTVKYNGYTLTKGKDYTLAYKNNVVPGTSSVIITGKGNFAGSVTKTFKILLTKVSGLTQSTQGTNYITLKWTKNNQMSGYQVYYATSKNGTYVRIGTTSNNTTLTMTRSQLQAGRNYYFKIRGYKKVNGKNYFGEFSNIIEGTTLPEKVAIKTPTSKSGETTISWIKQTLSNGYEIYYSLNKTSGYKKLTTIGNNTTTLYKTKGLTKGKTYYIRIRAYKKLNNKNYYGALSDIKSIKVK